MAKKQPTNQLGLDFNVRGDRLIYVINDEGNRITSRSLFNQLLHQEWHPKTAGADITSGQEEIRLIGHRLLYPETVKIARLFNQSTNFQGFSAIYDQTGWVFVNAEADSYDRRFAIFLLVATLGLYSTYPNEDALRTRAEQLVMEVLMPEKDINAFLTDINVRLSPALAGDMSDFFKVPFAKIPARALQLNLMTQEEYDHFPIVRPSSSQNAKEIFISHDASIADDLENYLFGLSDDESE